MRERETASNGQGWQAGLAAVDITPSEPIWLSGWGDRKFPSQGVSQRIFVKVLALKFNNGPLAILLGSDLMAYSVEFVEEMSRAVQEVYGVPRARFALCATHNHSAPVTTNVLPIYYDLTEAQTHVISRYSDGLRGLFLKAIGDAIQNLTPANIEFGQNIAGFATNRRRHRPGGRPLPGVVDHDVPVLCIRSLSGTVRGVVFGYACHTTCVKDDTINGDYAGYAQAELEKMYPGAVAMFIAGCGGDAGPNPRFKEGLAESYGHILATAVNDILIKRMSFPPEPIDGPLEAAYGIAGLSFQTPPNRQDYAAMLPGCTGMGQRQIQYQIDKLDDGKPLASGYDYPLQVWRFGSGHTFIIMSSEVVSDYSICFKQTYGFDKTWVMAYANEHIAYIPSERILREGGYEGTDGMLECGFPSPFTFDIERTITDRVADLWRQAGVPDSHSPEQDQ